MKTKNEYGCEFRRYHRHDGGAEFLCALRPNYCCVNHWDEYYEDENCKYKKKETIIE